MPAYGETKTVAQWQLGFKGNMKTRIKTACSIIALVGWFVLAYQRSSLISSGQCELDSLCDHVSSLKMSLVGFYICLELLIAPESAAFYLLGNAIRRDSMSPAWARLMGAVGTIFMLYFLYLSIRGLFRLTP
jgi:hypothetical protein